MLDITAISTPLDNVPLYSMQSDKEPTMLLKPSQAVSISDRLSEGTPAIRKKHNEQGSITVNENILVFRKILSHAQNKPVTNAFCNCPLKPVAQGLTVTTLLPRQHRM